MTQQVTGGLSQAISKEATPANLPAAKVDAISFNADILVIEDEPLVAALMKRYLGSYVAEAPPYLGLQNEPNILTLESGFELLRADLSHIKVAIVDLLLPQITGVDLIRDFRKRFPKMGIIAVSGMATAPMQRQLKEILPGELRFLRKPLRKEEFYDAFERAMNFHQVSKQFPEQPRPSSPVLTEEGGGELWTVVRAPNKTGTAIQVERRGLMRKKAAA